MPTNRRRPTQGAISLPECWTTARLRAERLRPEHAAEIRRMHGDAIVMAHLGGVRDEAASVAYFERNLRHWDQHGFGLWIVYERDGSEPIGRAMLRWLPVEEEAEVEVGYAFYQPFWRRGLATEVTTRCIDLARREIGAEAVVALTSPSNIASQRVLTNVGFVYEREFPVDGEISWLFRYRIPHDSPGA